MLHITPVNNLPPCSLDSQWHSTVIFELNVLLTTSALTSKCCTRKNTYSPVIRPCRSASSSRAKESSLFVSTTITGGSQDSDSIHTTAHRLQQLQGKVNVTSRNCGNIFYISVEELRVAGVELDSSSQFEFGPKRILNGFPQGVDLIPSV